MRRLLSNIFRRQSTKVSQQPAKAPVELTTPQLKHVSGGLPHVPPSEAALASNGDSAA